MTPDLEHAESIDTVFALRQIASELTGAYQDAICNAANRLEQLADDARWILTSEKMPDAYQTVLVHGRFEYLKIKRVLIATWWLSSWVEATSLDVLEDVTHWRHLPALPEGK